MAQKTIWTSNLTKQQVKDIWNLRRERCPWMNLGNYQENKEEAQKLAYYYNDEALFFLSEQLSKHLEKGCTLELFKKDLSDFVLGITIKDKDDLHRINGLVTCIDHALSQGLKAALKIEEEELFVEVWSQDWPSKEGETERYLVRVNGNPIGSFFLK